MLFCISNKLSGDARPMVGGQLLRSWMETTGVALRAEQGGCGQGSGLEGSSCSVYSRGEDSS